MGGYLTVERRFWSHVDMTTADECWPWAGGTSTNGYGRVANAAGQLDYAHRVAYELLIGPIPAGLQIDHLCRNRLCCNPRHLEAVTSTENKRRGESVAAVNARRTHCLNGHPFSSDNTYVRRDGGGRQCRTCRRLRMRGVRHAAA